MNDILIYFAGEKQQCTIGIFLGLLSLALSVYFIYSDKVFLKGIATAFIPLSILLMVICIGIVIRTPKDINRVTNFFENDPIKIQTEELPRMEKVMKTFPVVKIVEVGFIITGILLLIAFREKDLLKGIGAGLIIQGIMLYGFDYMAESRGKVYFEFLTSARVEQQLENDISMQ